ncbi:transcription termination factor Rho [Blautia schinkii]|nr:transcription termination factor Rho [Blautia schinkii]
MREKYESLSLAVLKDLAKARGLKGISTLRKPALIERMLEEDEKQPSNDNKVEKQDTTAREKEQENAREQYASEQQAKEERNAERERSYDNRGNQEERKSSPYRVPAETVQLDSGEKANGILEVLPDGYGFIRCENYLPGENDIYVSPSQIRRFNLKTGDIIQGNIRIKTQSEKFSALLYVTSINGFHPSEGQRRYNFEDMTPIFPNERLVLERTGGTTAMRIVDLISPIGKGQRGMIVSPPKAGKTTLLKDVAKSILTNSPDMHLIILLIDERPEEVTDIREAIQGPNVEVIYSTFDELPEHHKRVSEMVVERARRLVEHKKDVTILLDSITRLARAYNLIIPPSGRTLSGGLDPAALHMPKRFFGAARNMREGGSLTILATALVDTGSKMDDVIYEEFKGTGNMELVLDRKLQEKRVFPAIDIQKSGTRREDLLLNREEQDAVYNMRKALNGMKSEDAVEQILNMFARTRNNAEFVQTVKKQKFL